MQAPTTQYRLCGADGGFVARLDLAWPGEKVALEMDGYRHHSGIRAFRADRERGNRVQAEGWTVLRTTPAEVSDGAPGLVAALRRLVGGVAQP